MRSQRKLVRKLIEGTLLNNGKQKTKKKKKIKKGKVAKRNIFVQKTCLVFSLFQVENISMRKGRKHSTPLFIFSSPLSNQTPFKKFFLLTFSPNFSVLPKISPNKHTRSLSLKSPNFMSGTQPPSYHIGVYMMSCTMCGLLYIY